MTWLLLYMGHFFTPAIRLVSFPEVGINDEIGDCYLLYENTLLAALPAHLGLS